MDREPDCLIHCNSICCRGRVYLNLYKPEAGYFNKGGIELVLIKDYSSLRERSLYLRVKPCKKLQGNVCTEDPRVTGKADERPPRCSNFRSGEKACLVLRAENPEGITLTEKDVKFQTMYFGGEDY